MANWFSRRSPFERASFIRHVALCASALLAYTLRADLRVGNSILWIFAIAALMNFQTALLWNRPLVGSFVRCLSPAFGLGGWIALMLLTGGVASPFAAGLWLEITLAAIRGNVLLRNAVDDSANPRPHAGEVVLARIIAKNGPGCSDAADVRKIGYLCRK